MLIKFVYTVNPVFFAIRNPFNTFRGKAVHPNMTVIVVCIALLVAICKLVRTLRTMLLWLFRAPQPLLLRFQVCSCNLRGFVGADLVVGGAVDGDDLHERTALSDDHVLIGCVVAGGDNPGAT